MISTIVLSYPDLELGDILPDPDPDLPANDPSLTQTNLTDLQFLQALAVRYRARAFVENCRHGDPDLENYFFFVAESTIAGQTASTTLRCCGGFHELLEFRMLNR